MVVVSRNYKKQIIRDFKKKIQINCFASMLSFSSHLMTQHTLSCPAVAVASSQKHV